MKFRQAFICLSIVFVFLIAGCEKPAQAPMKMSDVKVAVVTSKAVQRDVQLTASYTGKIVPVSEVDIVPRIRGYLEAVKYLDGSIVEKGQLLFTIQDFDYKIDVEKAQAEMVAAKANEISARTTYESSVKSNEKVPGTVSENDIVKYRSSWQEAYATFNLKKSQYDYQMQQLSYTKIYSPIKGKISKTEYTPGQLLDGTGSNPPTLCTVTSMDPIYVEFQVPDRDFDKALKEVQMEFQDQNPDNSNTQPQAQPATHTVNYPPEGESPLAEEIAESEIENSAPTLPAGQTTAPVAQATNGAAVPGAPASNNAQTPVKAPAQANAADPVTELNQAVSTAEQTENKAFQPFIPKDEDIAPSAALKDNAAFMVGDKKIEASIPIDLVLSDEPGATVYHGKLNYNDSKIDVSTGTMTLRGVFSNPTHELYPGHICTVRLDGDLKKGAIVVEERALCDDLSAKYVWVVDDKGVATKRYVVLENSFERGTLRILAPYTEQEITTSTGEKFTKKSGLKPGETYIVEGFLKVREGMTVTTKQE